MKKHIIFVSNTCSNNEFIAVQDMKYKEKLNPSQKFYDMLINGFCVDEECYVDCVTARAIAHSNSKIKKLSYKEEKTSEKLRYIYTNVINIRLVRNVVNVMQSFKYTKKLLKNSSRNEKVALVCDPLAYDICIGALLASMRIKIKKLGIVTDLPFYMTQMNKSGNTSVKKKIIAKFREHIISKMMNSFDCFCFLTESMNIINNDKKEYVVVEGMMPLTDKRIIDNSVDNNVILYAGGLFKQFGIDELVDAASEINFPGFELHLYGEGTSVEYIKQKSIEYPHVKYMGVAKLEEIYEIERNAKVLINPRPTNEKFTEYSFPSKTLEYLSTARPILSTRLKGIPTEYFNYIIPIEDESKNGIKNSLLTVLSMDIDTLNQRGMDGYNFAIETKNNVIQANRLIEFLFERNEGKNG